MDRARNALIVGYDEATLCPSFTTGPLFWGALPAQADPFNCLVQLRSRHQPGPARVIPGRLGATVTLTEPQRAVTPGQWAVFYDQDGYVLAAAEIRGVPGPDFG
jgi:tRNA-specific 2-thiouridylase